VTKEESFADNDNIRDHIENKQFSSGFSSTILVTKKKSFADNHIIEDHIDDKQLS
jgi:hypothetical protein